MKHLIIAASLLLIVQQSNSQTPLYMLFNSGCMDQLEYKNSLNGSTYSAFGIHGSNNDQYLLRTGEATLTSTTLPKGTMTCGNLTLGEQLLSNVNDELRPVYILIPNNAGYSMMPVTVVTQFTRSGSYIFVKSDKYAFAIDTSSLAYDQNLASAGSQTKVFFGGVENSVCKERFRYSLLPVSKSDAEYKTDVEYIPGVGITAMRFGEPGPKQEVQTLERINGVALITHISKLCGTKTEVAQPVAETTVKPVATAPTTKTVTSDTYQPVKPISNPYAIDPAFKPLAECPEKPGYGFHIVQPGESLNAISRTYGVSTKQIIGWNKIKDADHIERCQKIWLIDPPKPTEPVKTSQTTNKTVKVDPGVHVVSQAPMWELEPGQAGPPQYGLTSKSPTETAPGSSKYHIVQKGETVSQLSKRYGFTESKFREQNKLAAKGDVVIFPGQKLYVENPNATAAKTPPTTQPTTVKPTPPATEPAKTTAVPKTVEEPKAPVVVVKPVETVVSKPVVAEPEPEVFSEQVVVAPANKVSVTTTIPATTTKTETVREPSYIQEYVVRDGDTIESVSKKFGITQKELSDLNGKRSDEALSPGMRLMIPRY